MSALVVGALLVSGCAPIPDAWPEAEAACVELDEGCIDVMREHFGSQVTDETHEVLFLQGMRWFVRWDIDGVELDFVRRAPGEGTTQQLYNWLAWRIEETVDNDDITGFEFRGGTARVGEGVVFTGMPWDETSSMTVPAWVLIASNRLEEREFQDVFAAARDRCEEGTPSELTETSNECFPWWAWAEWGFEAPD